MCNENYLDGISITEMCHILTLFTGKNIEYDLSLSVLLDEGKDTVIFYNPESNQEIAYSEIICCINQDDTSNEKYSVDTPVFKNNDEYTDVFEILSDQVCLMAIINRQELLKHG